MNNEKNKMIMKRKRIEYVDYAKAFAIVSVLLSHSAISFQGMCCFSMAVFFISAGYTFNSVEDSFGSYFIKKVKRLLVPFWMLMAVSALLEVVRARFIGYGSERVVIPVIVNLIYGSGLFPNCGSLGQMLMDIPPFTYNSRYMIDIVMPTNSNSWTLPALFSGYMIYYLYRKTVKKASITTDVMAIMVMLLLASIETIPGIFQLPFGIGRGFICVAFMIAGFWFREHKIFEDTKVIRIIISMTISTVVSVVSVLLGSEGTGYVISYYGPYGILSVALTFLCGLSSAYIVIMICRFIYSFSIKPVNNLLAVIGRNTMDLYLWHFAVFFVIDVIFILIFNPVLSPNIFFDELFSEGYLLYRVIRLTLTMICLTLVGKKAK